MDDKNLVTTAAVLWGGILLFGAIALYLAYVFGPVS